jgi:hypothetical protein
MQIIRGAAKGAKMSVLPGFGELLSRLLERRQLNVRDLPDLAGIHVLLGEARGSMQPSSSLLRELAPVLGLHAADLFAIAGLRVPDDLAPVDGNAGIWVVEAVRRIMRLALEDRGSLLEFTRALPPAVAAGTRLELQPYEQYPAEFGGMLMRMLHARNLGLLNSAGVIAALTDGRIYWSASAFRRIGVGDREVTPELLAGMAAALDIPSGDLVALGGIGPSAVAVPPGPAVAGAAELIWEARRLTTDQVRLVCDQADSMLSESAS